MSISYCPYCNRAQSLLMGNIYCSHQSLKMENLENGVMLIKGKKLEETHDHVSRLSIRCIRGGEQYYKVGSREFKISDENYLVINKGQHYKTSFDGDGEKEMMLIAFKPGYAEEVLYSIMTDEDKLLDDPYRSINQPLYFFEKTYEEDPLITDTFKSLRRLMNEDPEWKKTVDLDSVYSGVLTRLLHVHRGFYPEINKIKSAKFSTRKELYRRLITGKEYLENNLHRKISIEEVSSIATMSPHHFKRTFKNLFGETPHNFHVRKRLEYSKRLIKKGELNISEICRLIGFENTSSFIRLFKTNYGLTPGNLKGSEF